MADPAAEPILRVEGLTKQYDTTGGFVDRLLGREEVVRAVDGVDLRLYEGETLGVVGESGCGKTTLGRAMLQLVEPTAGSVYYCGEDLTEASRGRLREVRKDLQYVFQDPFSSLDPRMTVGDIVGEPLDIHDLASGRERTDRVNDLLETVGLSASHAHRYPHEFSGGQRQRIGIARALAVDPEVVVCDEPVSALDVSVQAQILNLLEDLQAEFGLSYVFIAHDLSVVEHISDRVAVMYLGEIAAIGATDEVFSPPHHPYTEALLSAIPEPDPLWEGEQILLSGGVPSPIDPPSGCRFHTRCPQVVQPEAIDVPQGEWRAVMDLKIRLADADAVEAMTAHAPQGGTDGRTDSPVPAVEALVREEFGLPDRLSDAALREAFANAVAHLADDDVDGAHEALSEAVHSPCRRERPSLHDVTETHRVACLRFDESYPDPGETPTANFDVGGPTESGGD